MNGKRIVAFWESKSGKHTAILTHDDLGYAYAGTDCLGTLCAPDDASAIKQVEAKVSAGYFQPDANKTPMRRTA